MRYFLLISSLFFYAISHAQTSKSDDVRKTLKGAAIPKTITHAKTILLSDRQKSDTIILTVPAGLISRSRSKITIKSFDGKTIYNEVFRTYFFIRGIFEPDTTPQGEQEIVEKFMDDYANSITKSKFEKVALTKIGAFLKDINNVSRQEMEQYANGDGVSNMQLYRKIMKEKPVRVIWLPCFECDEGIRYLAYSADTGKAVKFIETD